MNDIDMTVCAWCGKPIADKPDVYYCNGICEADDDAWQWGMSVSPSSRVTCATCGKQYDGDQAWRVGPFGATSGAWCSDVCEHANDGKPNGIARP